MNGTKRLIKYLKRKREKINFCIVGEPTNPNKLGEMIKIGRRGSLTGRLTIIGSQGHVAYPHRANNPSSTLIKILKKIKDLKLDKGTKNFQPSNLEVTKINIDNHAEMSFQDQLRLFLISDLMINTHLVPLKINLIKYLNQLRKLINLNLK